MNFEALTILSQGTAESIVMPVIVIRAVEFIGNTNFDILIGMDILMLGDLAITNAEKRTLTSFRVPPAPAHIDFVKK